MSESDGVRQAEAGEAVPRVVTTGRKIPASVVKGIDEETGELVELHPMGKGFKVLRRLALDEAASPHAAIVDALTFTIVPPDDQSMPWVVGQMRQFLPIGADGIKHRSSGGAGFKQSAEVGTRRDLRDFDSLALVRWGGVSQRGRVLFSMMGKGCSLVSDWPGLAAWLQHHRARITRVDAAHDDVEGALVSIEWAVEQYRAGGFNAGGRTPCHGVAGDWLDGPASKSGRTLYVGNRASGKLCRVYEKGKQLGEPCSLWTRIEVEWHSQDRVIPFDVLTRPGQYLAGAYPCVRLLSTEQDRVRTQAKGALVSFDKAVENGKQMAGKLVHLMLRVYGGDCGEVVQRLRREGVPSRIVPFSYQVADSPELLDDDTPGSYAELLDGTGWTDGRAASARLAGDAGQPIA
jgi:phage replication initiation protein